MQYVHSALCIVHLQYQMPFTLLANIKMLSDDVHLLNCNKSCIPTYNSIIIHLLSTLAHVPCRFADIILKCVHSRAGYNTVVQKWRGWNLLIWSLQDFTLQKVWEMSSLYFSLGKNYHWNWSKTGLFLTWFVKLKHYR